MDLATAEHGITIVIVDDNADHGVLLRESVQRAQINNQAVRVMVYEDADIALAELPPVGCVVVLIDYRLRGSSGLEWLTDFTRAAAGPVIMMTSSGDEQVAAQAFRLGAMDYLDKGAAITDPAKLVNSIEGALRRYKLERTNKELSRELKLANGELRAKNDRLAELTQNAQQFVNDVAHEFRTPLAAIKEFASIIADGIGGSVTATQSEYLGHIQGAAVDLAHLVDDFLDTGKLRSGTLRVSRRPCTPAEVLDAAWPVLESRAGVKGVRLVRDAPDELPEIFVDAEKVSRSLVNLATNAIKFSNEQGKVTVRVEPEPGRVRFSVIDEGPGLSETEVSDLFERFHQGPGAQRIAEKGFGLGLSIVKDLVAVNLGLVDIDSVPGEGSRFSFTVPRKDLREVLDAYLAFAGRRNETSSVACIIASFEPGGRTVTQRLARLEDVTYCTDLLLPMPGTDEIMLLGQTPRSREWADRLERDLAAGEVPPQTSERVHLRRVGVWSLDEADVVLNEMLSITQGGAEGVHLSTHR